jgi:hypothetical protein
MFRGFRWGRRGHASSAAFSFRCGAIRYGANSLKLALHFCRPLTDIHRLAHCNERGRAHAYVRRVDNGDNLRRRDVHVVPCGPASATKVRTVGRTAVISCCP